MIGTIIHGDAREVLKTLPDGMVDCVVTSPPYYRLRDYGVDGQIGLEQTPEEYVDELVGVFREVRRVLRDNGTLWVNLGDSYANRSVPGGGDPTLGKRNLGGDKYRAIGVPPGLKPKDLIGIPWMVAFALRADGWWLRQDIVWSKSNPLPQSVKDRCTTSHEYIFLLSKSHRYHFDADAIKERGKSSIGKLKSHHNPDSPKYSYAPDERWKDQFDGRVWGEEGKANKRSVWTVAVKPFREAHFATYPPELITPCILAGCPPGGIVLDPFCGAGTTAWTAAKLGRQYIGIELNADFIEIANKRLRQQALWGME